jgi:hypothetical protein
VFSRSFSLPLILALPPFYLILVLPAFLNCAGGSGIGIIAGAVVAAGLVALAGLWLHWGGGGSCYDGTLFDRWRRFIFLFGRVEAHRSPSWFWPATFSPSIPSIIFLALGGYYAYRKNKGGDATFKRQATSRELQHFHDPSGPKLKKADSVLVEMANPTGTGKNFGAAVL